MMSFGFLATAVSRWMMTISDDSKQGRLEVSGVGTSVISVALVFKAFLTHLVGLHSLLLHFNPGDSGRIDTRLNVEAVPAGSTPSTRL